MPVHIWDHDGGFLGALQQWHTFTTEHFLSEASTIDIEAPYSAWRNLISGGLRHALVEVTGPEGERIMRGRWTGRGDDPETPAAMSGACACLLEELRLPCVPPEYYITHHSGLDALREVLSISETDWVLGDINRAADITVSANLSGMSCLEAFIELCKLSGNYFRHNGWNRVLDVFMTPFPEIAAYLVCANPSDELPQGRGLVETLRPDVDEADVLRAVWPEGGKYKTADGEDRVLRPLGEEVLPAGFVFEGIGGHIAIANNAVELGLVRVADFRRVQALSNLDLSASGFVESSTPGAITSETLRRPQNDFWSGGTLEISGAEFSVGGHNGATIVGTWDQAFAEETLFSVRKTFPEDVVALEQARQDLVDAACGLLRERQEAALEIEVGVSGLEGGLVKPGDIVRLECLGHVELHDALTGEVSDYIWDDFRGNLVVVSVTTELRGTGLFHTFSLSDRLRLLPTTTGLRETHSLAALERQVDTIATVSDTEAVIAALEEMEGFAFALGGVPALQYGLANAAGIASKYVRTDASLAIFNVVNPTTILPGVAATPGILALAARGDHRHGIVIAAPTSPSVNLAASTKGGGNSFAGALHTHQLCEAIAPTWTNKHTFTATLETDKIGVSCAAPATSRAEIKGQAGDAGLLQFSGECTTYVVDFSNVIKPAAVSQALRLVAYLEPQAAALTFYGQNLTVRVRATANNMTAIISSFARATLDPTYTGTITNFFGYRTDACRDNTAGAADITNIYCFEAYNQTIQTGKAVAFRGRMVIGVDKWNAYMSGDAQNWFAGWVGIGVATSVAACPLHVRQASATGAVPVLTLDQDDVDQPYIEFLSGTVYVDKVSANEYRMVKSGGNTRYLPLYKDPP